MRRQKSQKFRHHILVRACWYGAEVAFPFQRQAQVMGLLPVWLITQPLVTKNGAGSYPDNKEIIR